MKNQGLLLSTAILATVNIIIRILGFAYRIILVRLIGSEGLGLFELISPITMLIFTLVGSGIPIGIIRLTTQSLANNKEDQSFKVVEYIAFLMVFISLVLSILLFIWAPFIAKVILKDARLLTPLYIFSPVVLLPSLAAILRGYFYGKKQVIPPAISQLTEQIVRIIIVLILLSILYPFREEVAISISMVGVIISELIGFFVLIFFYYRSKKSFLIKNTINDLPFFRTIGNFSKIAIPITFSRAISSILRVATSVIIPSRLIAAGLDNSTALSKFGQVNGMAMPLIFLPFTLTSALVMNLIPRISEAMEKRNFSSLNFYIDKTFHLVFFISLPLSGIFYIYSKEIFSMLYGNPNGEFLSQLSIATLFLCVYQVSTSILQGIGKQVITTVVYILGMVFQLFFSYTLVGMAKFQIFGYIISYLISFFFISLVNFILILYYTKVKINIKEWVLIPSLASILALIFSKYLFSFLLLNFNSNISLIFSIFLMGIFYLIILLITGNLQSLFKKSNNQYL